TSVRVRWLPSPHALPTHALSVPGRSVLLPRDVAAVVPSTPSTCSAPFLRALWLVCASKVCSGLGADIVMESLQSSTRSRWNGNGVLVPMNLIHRTVAEIGYEQSVAR